MAAFHTVARALVERHDLVLASVQAVPINRSDLPGHRPLRSVRAVVAELTRRNGSEAVAHPGFDAQRVQQECGRNDLRLAQAGVAALARQRVLGRADVGGLVAQQLLGGWVEQRFGFAEDAVLTFRVVEGAAHIGGVAPPHHDAAFLRGDDAWRSFQLVGAEDHRLVQKRFDEVERNGRDRAQVIALAAHLRRQFQCVTAHHLPDAQARAPVALFEQ